VTKLDKRTRVLHSLNFEEPDRVPIMEMDIDVPLMERITGKQFHAATSLQTQVISDPKIERQRVDLKVECYEIIDFDVLTIDLSAPEYWKPTIKQDGTMVDLWGRVLKLDKQSRAWVPFGTIFSTPEDFKTYNLPDPQASGWTYAVEYAKSRIGDKMALATFIRDPFANAWEMFTPTKFVTWMYQQPAFIEQVIQKLTDFNIEIIHQIADSGVDFVISGGDYCEVHGPMVPIQFFKKVIFPCLKKQVDAANHHGMKFVKHTDGNIIPIINDMAKVIDGLHSLDPSAGVDIGQVKTQFGENLVLIGNVSVDNLAKKTKTAIIQETIDCMKQASPGGGHILSSSNSWAAGAQLENCLAMVETGRTYGSYPINI
jgi:uroporphyrinogen decarboxylase